MNRAMQWIAVCANSMRVVIVALASLAVITPRPAAAQQAEPVSSLRPASPAGNDDRVQPAQPAENTPDITLDPAMLLPELPPLPAAKATVVGGVIAKLDRVQDQLTIQVFGGSSLNTLFDPRTRIYRNGKPASLADLKRGERIYADTILVGGRVFARNIRLSGAGSEGHIQGVVISYRGDTGVLILRDALSPDPLQLRLTSSTGITHGDQPASIRDLVTGTLVAVQFQNDSGRTTARQVSVLIAPGTEFTFTGRVTSLDLHKGLLVVTSSIDHKTYEIDFDPSAPPTSDLREGADVTVLARYGDNRYIARGVTVNSMSEK